MLVQIEVYRHILRIKGSATINVRSTV